MLPFKKKSGDLCVICDIPGWEDPQFSSLVKEWALGTGLSEHWGGKLYNADVPQLAEVLKTVPVEVSHSLDSKEN